MVTPLSGLHSFGFHHHVEQLELLDGYIRESDYDAVGVVGHLNFIKLIIILAPQGNLARQALWTPLDRGSDHILIWAYFVRINQI